jgi:hypothetical protein
MGFMGIIEVCEWNLYCARTATRHCFC